MHSQNSYKTLIEKIQEIDFPLPGYTIRRAQNTAFDRIIIFRMPVPLKLLSILEEKIGEVKITQIEDKYFVKFSNVFWRKRAKSLKNFTYLHNSLSLEKLEAQENLDFLYFYHRFQKIIYSLSKESIWREAPENLTLDEDIAMIKWIDYIEYRAFEGDPPLPLLQNLCKEGFSWWKRKQPQNGLLRLINIEKPEENSKIVGEALNQFMKCFFNLDAQKEIIL